MSTREKGKRRLMNKKEIGINFGSFLLLTVSSAISRAVLLFARIFNLRLGAGAQKEAEARNCCRKAIFLMNLNRSPDFESSERCPPWLDPE
jgi:hypothetical protein